MKGLLKSNFYASFANIKLFSIIMIIIGISAAAAGKAVPSLMINYSFLSMLGFSLNAIGGIQRENASNNWGKYKLTTAVKRVDIVKSYYICHALWLLIGILFAAFFLTLSFLLHGFFFDRATDIPMIFTAGVCICLLVGAIFFPIFYAGGSERYEVSWTISVLCSVGIFFGITWIVNYFFHDMTDFRLIMTDVLFVAASFCIFVLSFFISVKIFGRKEY